jgi:siderophore synthetase component
VLAGDPTLALLAAEGSARWLGPRGDPVWPTSSVRTVVDTVTGASWKLPLRARLTHFVRTTPPEQAQRAVDAAAVVAGLGPLPAGFGVVADRGYATLDPAVGGERLAADLTVVTRAPFPPGGPRVMAALLEDGPAGAEPPLVHDVRATGDAPAWLRRWLAVSLVPLLRVYGAHGLGFEAHPQNTLVVTDADGWPAACWVRDLEGAHVRADRVPPGLPAGSPLVYAPEDAWRRLRYHAVVNHLALLVAVLGRHTVGEDTLWATVADVLAGMDDPGAAPWAADLLTSPTLPAKAHLRSWAAGTGEDPLYVDVGNPIAAAARGRMGA